MESLYRAYRAERNSGLPHSEIVESGWAGQFAEEFALRYSQELAIYADYMPRQECDNRGDCDVFGQPLKAGS